MVLLTDKFKDLSAWDNVAAQDATGLTRYTIELMISKSKLGAKCGGICVYKIADAIKPDFTAATSPEDLRNVNELEREIAKEIQTIHEGPILFAELEGKWLPWAIDEVMRLVDKYNKTAAVIILAPKLDIRESISRESVNSRRGDLRAMFRTLFLADTLLDKDYAFDPWGQQVRRGRVGAKEGK